MTPYRLLLFLTGESERSRNAAVALRAVCEKYIAGQYVLTLVNVLEQPEMAEEYRVMATPTVIRESPPPIKRVIGDITSEERFVEAMGFPSQTKITSNLFPNRQTTG